MSLPLRHICPSETLSLFSSIGNSNLELQGFGREKKFLAVLILTAVDYSDENVLILITKFHRNMNA